jgi:5S rRNA maturation endonuclease (ribonuclease M5)
MAMIDKREKMYQAFESFISGFVLDLNKSSEDGWAVLVEGRRDELALRKLGYRGAMATVSSFSRLGRRALGDSTGVMVLTDLDREGGILAARFIKKLGHEGIATSLAERRRLKAASKGVFLHIENLARFADTSELQNRTQEFITTLISPDPS